MFGRKALARKLLYRRALLSNEIHTNFTYYFKLHWFAIVRIAFQELETNTKANGSWLNSSIRTNFRLSYNITFYYFIKKFIFCKKLNNFLLKNNTNLKRMAIKK